MRKAKDYVQGTMSGAAKPAVRELCRIFAQDGCAWPRSKARTWP